jgi:creatinine amidohydrolase/Fe(II)-dependent formamide hydrolase-like protein
MQRSRARSRPDPLDALRAFDRLEIGPARVEKRRVITPYRVTGPGEPAQIELIYRWEEDVFDPGDPADVNLASLVTAQVALNYGLFCDELVFHGPFDRHDRRLLEDMARNTAREIYVKKFLEPNPFLVGAVAQMPVVKRDSYLRAQLRFDDPAPPVAPASRWARNPRRIAVLSSGGKDSLLSFGLLREIGRDVHPLFVNESGRHWFTALNAYRQFRAGVEGTGRVWTNSDRVFSWMLRHLPFVRRDFADLRADEYPIRLWTVAVFLFGALPLMRRRDIGRIVIGDEFDTTVRSRHRGITHYDGLYDQSRHFDDALSRFFHRKKWGLSQFSILRHLSEMLIEKILAERYPDLLRHQVSCHATHIDGERVRPCGRCEKCRRIVGMLTALGADPTRCGYSPEQIEQCLHSLAAEGIHQESDGAAHLAWLLQDQGIISAGALGRVRARPRSQVMKVRIDRERAPLEAVPRDLREPLLRIFLSHAEGAVRRSGRVWIDCDPATEPGLTRPYAFDDSEPDPPADSSTGTTGARAYILGELTWPQARRRMQEVDLALLPVGALEQHGPHLPLDTDAFDAAYLAKLVAERCSSPRPLVLPLIPYGVSYHHDDFAGTISVSPDTLARLVHEIGLAVARNGITKLVIVNGHGGNGPALHFAAQLINRDAHIFTCVDTGETSDTDIEAMSETPNDVHAGEIETSTSLATRPELVDREAAAACVPEFSSRYLDFSSKRAVGWYTYTSRISASGVMGDPTKASAEKGQRMWDVMVQRMVEFVEDLKGMSLEEIWQKRY